MTFSISLAINEKDRTIRANKGNPVQFTDMKIRSAKLVRRSNLIIYESEDGKCYGRSFYVLNDKIILTNEEAIS